MFDTSAGSLTLSQFEGLSKTKAVRHFVTTRQGGRSAGKFDSLNLGMNVGDHPGDVLENRNRLCRALDVSLSQMVFAEQMHTGIVTVATASDAGRGASDPSTALPNTDGIVTNVSGTILVVVAADCCPVLLCDQAKGVIAAAHSGRMGIVNGILPNVIDVMVRRFSCAQKDIVVALGPTISGINYPIARDKAEMVRSALSDRTGSLTEGDRSAHLEITIALKEQLIGAGVLERHIEISGRDTFSDAARYYSERRDKAPTGRIGAGIWLAERE